MDNFQETTLARGLANHSSSLIPSFGNSDAPFGEVALQKENRPGMLFIDDKVEDWQLLAGEINSGLEVVRIDSTKDGIAQITQALQGRSQLSSIHIVSHGESGDLQLGNTVVNSQTLDITGQQLQSWSSALAADGDILLYGCNLAADDIGKAFVQKIQALTGADVAASTDLTGSTAKGGNWNLEYSIGKIEAANAFNTEVTQAYTSVLATYSVNAGDVSDTGSGTTGGLVWAIKQANSTLEEDTINLAKSTYSLNQINNYWYGPNGLPEIKSQITIEGNGAIVERATATGTPNFRFFYVAGSLNPAPYDIAPGNLTLKNLTLQGGVAKGGDGMGGGGGAGFGGAIFIRAGSLNLSNTTFTSNTAIGGSGFQSAGQGKGGAIFAVTEQFTAVAGTPTAPTIKSFSGLPTFSENTAPNASNETGDTKDVFGTITLADITAPTLSSTTPTSNATNVAVAANLVINFSENIVLGTGNITIHKANGTTVETIATTETTKLTIEGSKLTINPTPDLAGETEYYVQIQPGVIKDLAGNSYNGINDATTWKFTTADITAPTLSSTTPNNNATNVAVADNLVINFSEKIALGTGNITI
ncbi:DUF4347 domain-containing protein, partial [Scytonema sp. NUACC26]|uniref:DUF4347 domain-containing protein n=1 Tax=Scytonema sp. NUACC26 TaxID=3140176 RepID=UPI0038B2FDA4